MRFAFVFAVFACFLLRSTLVSPDHVDTRSTKSPTVAYFNTWTIGWNADRLKNGLSGYWDAPIFYPEEDTFAFSEPMPATLLVAPVVWVSGSPLLAYKVWLVLSLLGNGLAAVLLCHRLGFRQPTQWLAGFCMVLLPMSQQRIDVIQLVPIWGILWFFSCLHLMVERTTWRRGLECGCAFGICFWLCLHHSLFLSLVMTTGGLAYVGLMRYRAFFGCAFVAVLVAVPLVLPVAWPVSQATGKPEFKRSEKLIARLAARPHYYLASQDNSVMDPLRWWEETTIQAPGGRRFHIGWLKMLLAVIGFLIVLRTGVRLRWTIFLLIIGATAFGLSLGPHWKIAGIQPWNYVVEYVPGFGQVRNVFRFAWFVQIAVVLLAMEGFDGFIRKVWTPGQKGWGRRFGQLLLVILAVGATVEVWPEQSKAHYLPQARKHSQWVNFVKQNCPPGQPIACLPMSFGNRLRDLEIETRWMLLGLEHGIPMLNGYSGFFPKSYNQLQQVVNRWGASDELFNELIKRRVGLVVVARGFPITKGIRNYRSRNFDLVHEFADEIGVDVYSIRLKSGKSAR